MSYARETWEYTIGPDGSLHFNRRTEFWVMHAGCFNPESWHVRVARGVWVSFADGKTCVLEINM